MDEKNISAICQIYHEEVRKYVAPIYWGTDPYDAASVSNNGSCFALKISGKIIGITAAHVLYGDVAYFGRKEQQPNLNLKIGNLEISNIEERIIDHDIGLDVVTFNLTEEEVKQIDIRVYTGNREGHSFRWLSWKGTRANKS